MSMESFAPLMFAGLIVIMLIGFPVAESMFGIDGTASSVYVRTEPDQVDAVRNVLPATANPAAWTATSRGRSPDTQPSSRSSRRAL